MEYHTYQELVDRLNYLIKENKELTRMFYLIPLKTILKMLASPDIDDELKLKWTKIYMRKYKFLKKENKDEIE